MLDLLRARLRQRTAPIPMPPGDTALPARFRGRPAAASASRALPVIDLGRSVFAPEEFAERNAAVAFTTDYRMAVRTRDALVTTGELELAAALDGRMRALLGRSLRLRSVAAGSCGGCEAELTALGNVVFDMARFGIQFVASPRHADGIVVSGVVSANMCEALEKTYDAVPDPKIVIAVGACAISGGVFEGGREVAGIPPSIPVDLWIPGCPPHPLTILDGLLRLLGKLP
ncbi:MAG: NADH-quinone oxidoreductase subunit B family protein [Gemmatimonadaceae bacterium]